jgi:hypothetical protein
MRAAETFSAENKRVKKELKYEYQPNREDDKDIGHSETK